MERNKKMDCLNNTTMNEYSVFIKELRKFITKTECKCTYECAMTTNTLFNGNMFLKLLKQTTKDMFGYKS